MTDRAGAAAPARSVMDWPAIFAGAVIAAGATVVFSGFSAALGLGSVSAEPGEGLGGLAAVLVGIFAFVTMIASYALGGYIAGRMRTPQNIAAGDEVQARDGVHGLTVWAVGTLVGAAMAFGAMSGGMKLAGNAASTVVQAGGSAVGGALQGAGQLAGGAVSGVGQIAGGAISGVGQLAGGAVQGAGEAAGGSQTLQDMLPQAAQTNPVDYVTERLLRPEQAAPNSFSNEAIRREIASIMGTVLRTGDLPESDREYLKDAIAARTQLSEQEVDARVDQAVTEVQNIRNEAQARLDEAQARAEELATQARAEAERLQAEARQRLDDARQAAIDAAESARHAAVWTAFALAASSLIAAIAAFLAAIKGGQDRDSGRVWKGLIRGARR